MSDRVEELSNKVDSLAEQVALLASAVERLTLVQVRDSGAPNLSSAAPVSSFSVVSASERRVGSEASASSNGNYNLLAEEIPAVPDFCVALCGSLRSTELGFRDRASRAWESGWWARFTLENRIDKPRPSRPCPIANTVYVVLRAPGYECPLYVQSSSQYRAIVGDFKAPTVSHGFASLAEARVYCVGAGVTLPASPLRWNLQQ